MKKHLWLGLLVALIIAAFVSPFASSHPDGLERVAEDSGFLGKSEGQEKLSSPMPDYVVPGISNETAAGSAAGILGTILTFGVAFGVGKLAGNKNNSSVGKKKLES